MRNVNEEIRTYLDKNGRMSGLDICSDLGFTDSDVDWAEQNAFIERVQPPHGGCGPWFVACYPGRRS